MDVELIERVIREYFDEEAGSKLEDEDGWLYDGDSNWGFKPAELAQRIAARAGPQTGQ